MDESIWPELQIEETNDAAVIRRAYARRLKETHPEDDPEGFQRLRTAYESALFWSTFNLLIEEDATRGQVPEQPELDLHALPDPDSSSQSPDVAMLLQPILDGADTNPNGAIQNLRALLHSESLENIELRIVLEETLADDLCSREPFLLAFAESVAKLMDWGKADSDLRDSFAIARILAQIAGRRAYRRLIEVRDGKVSNGARQFETTTPTQLQRRAAAMLTSPFDPVRFRRNRWMHWRLTESIQNEIARFTEYSPAVEQHLDAKTIEWWSARNPLPDPTPILLFLSLLLLVPFTSDVKITAPIFGVSLVSAVFRFVRAAVRGQRLNIRRAFETLVLRIQRNWNAWR